MWRFRLFWFTLGWGVLDLGWGLLGFLGGGVLDLNFGLKGSASDFNDDLRKLLISLSLGIGTSLSFKSMYFGFDSKGFNSLVSLSNFTLFVSLVDALIELYPKPVLSPDILWVLINFLSDWLRIFLVL